MSVTQQSVQQPASSGVMWGTNDTNDKTVGRRSGEGSKGASIYCTYIAGLWARGVSTPESSGALCWKCSKHNESLETKWLINGG